MPDLLTIDFQDTRQEWDGFGVNYVEMTHSRDGSYEDYGSFSDMTDAEIEKVLQAIFGEDGLQPGVVKLFLSPYLLRDAPRPGVIDLDAYRFEECLQQTIFFAKEGIRRAAEYGVTLRFIATLYGPPPWATKQKIIRDQNIDPAQRDALATFMAGCVKYLREREQIPVEAISIHNEGEDPSRYPGFEGDDFNAHWTPDDIADMILRLRNQLHCAGLPRVKVTPGETKQWSRFEPVAWKIGLNYPQVLDAVGLLTSHGFDRDYIPTGLNFLRDHHRNPNLKPGLKAWVTSCSWYKSGGVDFSTNIVGHINEVGVNALIPWAIIQKPSKWPEGDPNPNPPFLVNPDATVTLKKSYYYYQQLARAGKPGSHVVPVHGDTYRSIHSVAFTGDAIVLINAGQQARDFIFEIHHSDEMFEAYRTTMDDDSFSPVGTFSLSDWQFTYTAPPLSTTTFFSSGT